MSSVSIVVIQLETPLLSSGHGDGGGEYPRIRGRSGV